MSISFNLGKLNTSPFSIGNPTLDMKANFINKYGTLASPYESLDSLGNQTFKTYWPILVSIVGIIVSIFCFIGSAKDKDPKTQKELERTTGKTILLGLAWFLLFSSIFGFGYGSYLYIAIYLPQYNDWFASLPIDAKSSLGSIKTIDNLVSRINSTQK
jgi:hypothetical protein